MINFRILIAAFGNMIGKQGTWSLRETILKAQSFRTTGCLQKYLLRIGFSIWIWTWSYEFTPS